MIELRNRSPEKKCKVPQPPEHAGASRALARGGIALLANSGVTALFGVAFWLVAARVFNTSTVGQGSALVSALLTVFWAVPAQLLSVPVRAVANGYNAPKAPGKSLRAHHHPKLRHRAGRRCYPSVCCG